MNPNKQIIETFAYRVFKQLQLFDRLIKKLPLDHFYVAGGAFLKDSEGVDVFFENPDETIEHIIKMSSIKGSIFTNGKSYRSAGDRLTFIHVNSGKKIKFHEKQVNDMRCFINSIDFAHSQIAQKISIVDSKLTVEKFMYSENFITAMLTQDTFYTGNSWNLESSLERAKKFNKRGYFENAFSYVRATDKITKQIRSKE